MQPLDPNTLKQIAAIVCGTDGNGPVHREYWQLEEFFANAGWTAVPPFDGGPRYGRDRWACDLLLDRRHDPESIAQVIRRLADPREYSGDLGRAKAATDQLNRLLALDGLRVGLSGGRVQILETDPSFDEPDAWAPMSLHVDITEIVRDPPLAELLRQRLNEAQTCREHGAHLSAVIMLGSVLEGALFDKIKRNMAQAYRSRPLRERDGQPLSADKWKLVNLIDVAHQCGWIELDIKRFSHELREYRNMVHAATEIRDMHHPNESTSAICWNVVVAALNDLARSDAD